MIIATDGKLVLSDPKKKQLLAIEISCPDNANVRAWIQNTLNDAIQSWVSHGALKEVGGIEVGQLRQVQGVIEESH